MTATIDGLPGGSAHESSTLLTSTPPGEGGPADASALLALDPFALPADQRQGHVVALQALAARVHATYLDALVATAGPVRQVREVIVEVDDDTTAARTAVRAHGGEAIDVRPTEGATGDPGRAGAAADDATGEPDRADADAPSTSDPADVEPCRTGGRAVDRSRTVTLVDEVVDALASKLHRSPGSVAHDVRRARLLHGPLAPVRTELAAGRLTATHVAPICEQAERMQPHHLVSTRRPMPRSRRSARPTSTGSCRSPSPPRRAARGRRPSGLSSPSTPPTSANAAPAPRPAWT